MLNKDYTEEFRPDLEEFRKKTIAFHNKELTVAEYKGFSGGFGSYAQRGGEKHMLRLRMAGGRLTKKRLKFVVDMIRKYHISKIKLTTCQSIQLHDLEAADLCEMIEAAWDAGMLTRGGGGDFPRNVMCTTLSGLQKGEAFDVLPYAEAAGNYMMRFIKGPKFPRKLKVCFSNTRENEPHATFRDLGFVAGEDHTFDVYAAGGLGGKPMLGVKVAEKIDPADTLYYIKAMVDTFLAHGNYENRAKARTRFLQESLGKDGFIKAYQENLKAAMEKEDLSFELLDFTVKKTAPFRELADPRAIKQKQEGLYSVFYQPVGGLIAPERFEEFYEQIKDMDEVELRLTPSEGLYVVNCTAEEAEQVLSLTSDSAKTAFERSVSCIGASTCQVGLGDSPALLQACLSAVKKENFEDGVLPAIHISGCPSSCSAHQTASIGFRGAMRQTPDGPKKGFAIFVNGCSLFEKEVIADTGKTLLEDEIPAFLVELGKLVTSSGLKYDAWILTHQADFDALLEKYTG